MSFLTIPSQEGLFTTVKAGKSDEEDGYSTFPADADADDEDDDEDDGGEENSFIPRSSPIPRKRDQSIFDEAAEYMRMHLSLPAASRRVSFADTTGGDLVDVREFVAFGSDEEEHPRFEAEGTCYRKHAKEPTYRINTEFNVATRSALAEAVQTNKVEVELLSPVEQEPLAFSGLVRVLNISYHKAVYIRSTMDHWATYFDHPAEYVRGSNDGETDAFSFKLSFAPPYDTHGSRIEFVVRYETSDGDFWANNAHMNYVVTLLVSDEDHLTQVNTDTRQEIRGILKAPKVYSVDNDGQQHMDEEDLSTTSHSEPVRPTPVCPIIIHPEMDLETADDPFGPPRPPDRELQSLDDASVPHPSPCMSSRNTTDQPLLVPSEVRTTLWPSESQPLPSLPCESDNQISERLAEDGSRSALQLHAPSTSTSTSTSTGTGSRAEGVEQERESVALDKLKPFTVTHPPIMEASVHFSGETDEEELLHMTLGDRRIKVAQIFSRGEKDLLNEKRKHAIKESEGGDVSILTHDNASSTKEDSDSEFNECQSESGLQKEVSLDNIVGNLRSLETEETLQAVPLASLNSLGIPDVPSTPNTLPPAAPVMLCEQPPYPFETSMTIKVENIDTVKAHSCMSKQLDVTSTDSETEQNSSVEGSRETQAVLRSRAEDRSDKEQNTKTDRAYEERAALGDTAAFSENGEMVQRATARSDIGETNGEEGFAHQSTNTDGQFLVRFGTSVKNNPPCQSHSGATTTQTSLVDADVIFSDAFDNLKETTGPRPEEESADLVSSDTWFTPAAPESPPSYGSSPSVGPSELATTPSVESAGSPQLRNAMSPPRLHEVESRVFLGEEEEAATSSVAADPTSVAAGVNAREATREGKTEVVEAPQVPGDALAEPRPNASPEAAEPLRSHPERNAGRNLRLGAVFLCGVVSISTALAEPGSLFFLGLAWVALFILITSD